MPEDALPAAALDFLADLRAHNTRAWFDANRSRYETDFVEPAKELVVRLGPVLERLSPGIRAEPRVLGSIFRIHRDTRFSPDKRPYKDHLDLWFWHGPRAAAVSGLFLRISPDGVTVGAGAHVLTKESLTRYRAAVCDPSAGAALRDVVARLEAEGMPIRGSELVRPPRGYAAPTDTARFLLHRSLFAARVEPPSFATEPDLVHRLEGCWQPLVPLHRWLVAHVQDGVGSHAGG